MLGIGIISAMDLCVIKDTANQRLLKKIKKIENAVSNIEEKIDDKNEIKYSVTSPIENTNSQDIFFEYSKMNPCVDSWLASENKCTDGSDDGKISFWSKAGNFVEGIAKTIVGDAKTFISDPKKVAKAAIVGAGLCVLASMPPLGTAIAATVAITGGVKLIANGVKTIYNGVKNAQAADSDAEAKDAWEQIGNGSFKTGLGIVAVVKGVSKFKDCLDIPSDAACEVQSDAVYEAPSNSIFEAPSVTAEDIAVAVEKSVFNLVNTVQDS